MINFLQVKKYLGYLNSKKKFYILEILKINLLPQKNLLITQEQTQKLLKVINLY